MRLLLTAKADVHARDAVIRNTPPVGPYSNPETPPSRRDSTVAPGLLASSRFVNVCCIDVALQNLHVHFRRCVNFRVTPELSTQVPTLPRCSSQPELLNRC